MTLSRYVVGIDLGTTNSALAYVDTGVEGEPALQYLNIAQVVQPGVVDNRTLLPSFLYLPGPGEQPAGSLKLPWAPERDFAVGEFARVFGSQVPTRLVASAKSWLCHAGIDRRQPVLPWKAPESGRHVSPLEASTYYLKHLVEAWNHVMANVAGKEVAEHRLENQDIILTVPASFDAVARRIPTQSAKHVRGRRVYGGTRQFLPLRVNQAGVMPVIFASSLLILPMFVFKWANQQFGGSFFMNLTSSFERQGYLYNVCYIVLIYFFCYFWTAITFNPRDMANNLKDYGSFIPGYRPGKRTADYLERVLWRITYVGAAFLAVVAIIPSLISAGLGLTGNLSVVASFYGGTGLLIVISVALDLVQKINSHLVMRNYPGLTDD